MSAFEKVRRYDLITNYRCGASIEEMERADDGEWARMEDVEAARAEDAARLKDAVAMVARLVEIIEDQRDYQLNNGYPEEYEAVATAKMLMASISIQPVSSDENTN